MTEGLGDPLRELPHCNEQSSVLRIATLNVQGLTFKLTSVLSLVTTYNIDILCLQETHLTHNTVVSAQHGAHRAGYNLLCSTPVFDTAGRGTSGVAVLCNWPVELYEQASGADTGRWMTVKVHRPRHRPFEITNVYLHSGNKTKAADLATSVLTDTALRGEDRLIIGDFNLTPFEEPIFSTVLGGALHMADHVDSAANTSFTTRTDGRYIDYCVHSFGMHPCARLQKPGVADHDLIIYDFSSLSLETTFAKPALGKIGVTEQVSTETWISSFPQNAFDAALLDGDIETAWNLLNSCANKILTVDDEFLHPCRGKDRAPRPVPRQHLKANRLLTFQERKLHRFRRQLQEYQVHCQRGRFDLKLHNNLWRRWAQLCVHYDSLRTLDFADPNCFGVIEQCISNLEQRARDHRIQAWQNRITQADAALFQWVRREASDSVFTEGVPLHPQAKVEHFQNEWQRMWNRAPRTAADLQPWLVNFPSGTWNNQLIFDGGELRQLTWHRRDKAAGPDGWRPCEWLLLPNQFFTCLAALWQACLSVQQVPQDWLHIRCVLVPKPEGGLRPISVACFAWRIGMTSILQQLQPWLDSWLPPFLLGGLKHRDAREAHELLHHDIFQALQTHRKFFGAKLDIRKCFDSVSPLQAIHVWDHLQAPTEVTGLLRFFYSFSARRFESQKVCAATEFTCSTSILQGCPASPALLAGLMSVWGFHVLRRAAVSISGYIDDRTVWALGNNGQQRVVDALFCTQQIDLAMGFSFHADKCELFATGKPSCTILKAAAVNSGFHWPVVGSFKLLGVQYNLSRRKFTPLADRLRNHVLQRLARIRITRLPFRTKIRAIRALVLSLFSHTGAWYGLSKKNLQRWRVCIERAMMTPVKSRSRLLLWACHFGAHLDPEFVMDFSVIRHELWKLSPSAQALRTRVSSSPRLREVLSKWQWQQVAPQVFATPFGALNLAWDGLATIRRFAILAWEKYLWSSEPRLKSMDWSSFQNKFPVLDTHKTWLAARASHRPSLRTALGGAMDGPTLSGQLGIEVACRCGCPSPSRQHLAWRCPLQSSFDFDQPANDSELRLSVGIWTAIPLHLFNIFVLVRLAWWRLTLLSLGNGEPHGVWPVLVALHSTGLCRDWIYVLALLRCTPHASWPKSPIYWIFSLTF